MRRDLSDIYKENLRLRAELAAVKEAFRVYVEEHARLTRISQVTGREPDRPGCGYLATPKSALPPDGSPKHPGVVDNGRLAPSGAHTGYPNLTERNAA